jgi:hypothetical protein
MVGCGGYGIMKVVPSVPTNLLDRFGHEMTLLQDLENMQHEISIDVKSGDCAGLFQDISIKAV